MNAPMMRRRMMLNMTKIIKNSLVNGVYRDTVVVTDGNFIFTEKSPIWSTTQIPFKNKFDLYSGDVITVEISNVTSDILNEWQDMYLISGADRIVFFNNERIFQSLKKTVTINQDYKEVEYFCWAVRNNSLNCSFNVSIHINGETII